MILKGEHFGQTCTSLFNFLSLFRWPVSLQTFPRFEFYRQSYGPCYLPNRIIYYFLSFRNFHTPQGREFEYIETITYTHRNIVDLLLLSQRTLEDHSHCLETYNFCFINSSKAKRNGRERNPGIHLGEDTGQSFFGSFDPDLRLTLYMYIELS